MTEEYRIPQELHLSQQFEVKGYFINMISAPLHTDPALGRFPTVLLFDNEKCNPAGRIHAVLYFHPYQATSGQPSLRDGCIYLHYPIEALEPLLGLLRTGRSVHCYYRGQGAGSYGGVQGGPLVVPSAPGE
ncbi:MAG: hypothetical protein H6713_41210 [Myxococcales bacterium]|nr:hypothetical protein [Myxococcales bacterium]MCB9756382.1 hypothetical protein [Myxococcales bacterium]